jgi:small subunit ribosomal protein S18
MAEERQGGEGRSSYNRDDRGGDRGDRGDRPQGSRFGGSQAPRDGGGERGGERGGARSGPPRRGGGGGRFSPRRKVCAFCVDNIRHVDYKDIARLRRHIGERGKIEPRRKLGTCARHQRSLTVAIKRARYIGLIPFTSSSSRG